ERNLLAASVLSPGAPRVHYPAPSGPARSSIGSPALCPLPSQARFGSCFRAAVRLESTPDYIHPFLVFYLCGRCCRSLFIVCVNKRTTAAVTTRKKPSRKGKAVALRMPAGCRRTAESERV